MEFRVQTVMSICEVYTSDFSMFHFRGTGVKLQSNHTKTYVKINDNQ